MTGAEQKKELHSSVYDIAKRLRGLVLANNYKDYILGIVFYRFLSEKIENRANKLLAEDNISYAEAWKDEEYKELLIDNLTKQVGYIIEPGDLFSQFVKDIENGKFDIERLQFAINNLVDSTRGKESEDDFNNLFDGMVLSSHIIGNSVKERSQTLSEIIGGVNNIDFSHDETEVDVLGDIYEYIIKYFASNAGQKAGEFYTPQPVSTLLAKLVTLGKTEVKSIYDPTCGSGSLLIRVSRQLEKIGRLYGQEKNPVTYNLARMNMLLHDISYKKFEILQGDTLENPKHLDERFEIIVANPPYSTPWTADSKFLEDERFSAYGKLAPSSKADYAFVQHMIHQLDDNGTMAVVLPHGILFRGNAEGVIRRYMVEEKNYIDAVIGLPENMFFGASIPTCIVVFKKCKTDNDTVVFIDASKEFEKDGNKNAINNEHIEKIVKAYEDRVDIDKYCHVATLSEIAENDYNLNIPRYVDTFEEEPEVDLAAVKEKIASLKVESEQLDKEIETYLAELGLSGLENGLANKLLTQQVRFKDQDGNDYPAWEEKTLGDICDIVGGGTPATDNNEYWEGNIQWFTPTEIGHSKYASKSERTITELGLNKSSAKLLPKGAILLTTRATLGEMSIAENECCTNQGFQSLIVKDGNITEYVYYLQHIIKAFCLKYASGSTFLEISKNQLAKCKIPYMCIEEQKKIASFFSSLDKKIEIEQEILNNMQEFKKGLLQKMFI